MSVYDFNPPSEEELELLIGPPPNPNAQFEEQAFTANPVERILEGLARSAPRPPGPARNFGEGLAYGFVGGLQGEGAKVATARERFDRRQEARRLNFDEQRRVATEKHREKKQDVIREAFKEHKATAKLSRVVTQEDVDINPDLARYLGKRMPARVIDDKLGQLPFEEEKKRITEKNAAAARGRDSVGEADAPINLTPEAVDQMAVMWLRAGIAPSVGRGKTGDALRARIYNRAAQIAPTVDISSAKADYSANRASLAKLTQMSDAIAAYKRTAFRNAEVMLNAMKSIPDSGSPLLNVPIRELSKRVLGSKEQAAYNAAVQTIVPEFSRILNNPNLVGVLSDSARQELERIIDGSFTLAQMKSTIDILKRDAKNRDEELQTQIRDVKARMTLLNLSGMSAPGGAPGAPEQQPQWVFDEATQTLVPAGGN